MKDIEFCCTSTCLASRLLFTTSHVLAEKHCCTKCESHAVFRWTASDSNGRGSEADHAD